VLGLDGIRRTSSSRIGPRASVRSSRLTTIGLSRRFLAGSNAAADNHRIGNARSSLHGGLSRTRVRLPPPPPHALMSDLEWQSWLADLHRNTGWPAWDVLNDLATESEPASTLEQIRRWSSGFAGQWCYRGHGDECWLTNRNGSRTLGISLAHCRYPHDLRRLPYGFKLIQFPDHTATGGPHEFFGRTRTLAAAIEDEQLMPDQHGFRNNGAESARPCQSAHGDNQMKNRISKSRIPAIVSAPQNQRISAKFGNSPRTGSIRLSADRPNACGQSQASSSCRGAPGTVQSRKNRFGFGLLLTRCHFL
jgi:hypothetical protein